ncbi:MAG: TIGR03364 family FAD-dependent oxidoreductase [Sphingobacteriales bacterium JAD_PAG50586_3]|nr:MAG: TIGR03364 family FAD-dependent oxidoreductase [Sphingobacteriales bacterium JAD_PAG50586_3]
MQKYDVAIVGGGIIGLAHAYAAAKRGLKVIVLEQNSRALGASVRNFGLLLPLAQLPGKNYNLAVQSAAIWKEVLREFSIWSKPNGLLVLALNELETTVMQEFEGIATGLGYEGIQYVDKKGLGRYSPRALNLDNLHGALYSNAETTINPPETVAKIAVGLQEKYKVDIRYNCIVKGVNGSVIETNTGTIHAERVVFCTGANWEQFYPELYSGIELKKCKLQMMRLQVPDSNWQLNEAVASGISMLHYSSFQSAPSIGKLKEYYNQNFPELEQYGIHILAVENNKNEILLGDSHEYSNHDFDPGNSAAINHIILNWAEKYLNLSEVKIKETWDGVYVKNMGGEIYSRLKPTDNSRIVNAVGGQGMTISFGLAEETFDNW